MENKTYNLTFKEKILVLYIFIVIVSQGMISPYFYLSWLLGGLMIFFLILRDLYKKKVQRDKIYTFIIVISWLFIPIANVMASQIIDLSEHFKYIVLYIFYVLISVGIISFFMKLNEGKRKAIMIFINEIWIFISIILYLVFIFFNDIYGNATFSGMMENRNIYAMTTTIFISYVIFFKNSYTDKKRINTLIIFSFFLVLASFSVKGFVGWLMIYISSNFYNSNMTMSKKRKKQLAALLLGFAIVCILIVTDNPIIYRIERFLMIFTSPEDLRVSESAYLRSFFINESINVIKENPLNGIGIRNSKYYLVPPHMKAAGLNVGTYSHNNFLEIMLSGGIFAFFLYYTPILMSMYKLRKRNSSLANYLFLLGLYKLFIDFGSVNYDTLIINIVLVSIIYGQFITQKSKVTQL